jgi:hypothetical protein
MSGGQRSGNGAMTELDDETVRKDDILSNRDKAQRQPGRGLDGKSVQVDEYKDNPANQRPSSNDLPEPRAEDKIEDQAPPSFGDQTVKSTETSIHVDRPGFDRGGAAGDTRAGKGLGLGADAKENRKEWGLPR